ncbi:hypothetical protein K435DRAFT_880435 [Dendrothele bispora CBS 962.96]|uniref:Uncharacterized protein n=1 Tax=Dendrothele bispora (strain CBS 962.96) TaxID=1314807 RepID=A0A4S8KKH5_DENBC|nr:hypothetical protein K435DRAFT_880435 [Dendrothele bispora CBS 962.96]
MESPTPLLSSLLPIETSRSEEWESTSICSRKVESIIALSMGRSMASRINQSSSESCSIRINHPISSAQACGLPVDHNQNNHYDSEYTTALYGVLVFFQELLKATEFLEKRISEMKERDRRQLMYGLIKMLAMDGYHQKLDDKCLSQYYNLTSLNKQEHVEHGAECIEEDLHLTQASISAVPYGPSLFYDPLISLFIFYGLFSLFTTTSLDRIVCFSPPSDCSTTTNTLEISQSSSKSKDFPSKTGSKSKLIPIHLTNGYLPPTGIADLAWRHSSSKSDHQKPGIDVIPRNISSFWRLLLCRSDGDQQRIRSWQALLQTQDNLEFVVTAMQLKQWLVAISLSPSVSSGSESFGGAQGNDFRGSTISHTGRDSTSNFTSNSIQIINACQCAISSGEGRPCHCLEQQDTTDIKEEEGSRHRREVEQTRSLRLRRQYQSSQETRTTGLPEPKPPPNREDNSKPEPDATEVRIQALNFNISLLMLAFFWFEG